ncbi:MULTISPECIES: DapH/DapD/GlmU-related protein [unclassified Methylophilus]|uniref:acyltransferase n=1 Tax=unclassified Methylophilus TaxID=2630143 RepID=UPI00036E184E|nr:MULTISPECIES: acyltransferase [unclassified Methylophilus]
MLDIHPSAYISNLADIEDSKRGSLIKIGANSTIDSFVKIKPAGGIGNLIIGEHSVINSGCVLYTGNGINIGNHVAIAANTTLAPVNHAYENKNILITKQGFIPSKGGITIEDDVWIGANCVILDGAILRTGCVIAAGSIIRGEIPAYSVNAGTPLRVIKWRK